MTGIFRDKGLQVPWKMGRDPTKKKVYILYIYFYQSFEVL